MSPMTDPLTVMVTGGQAVVVEILRMLVTKVVVVLLLHEPAYMSNQSMAGIPASDVQAIDTIILTFKNVVWDGGHQGHV